MATARQTAEALEGSIEKWRKIVAGEDKDDGPDNCPLCHLFIDKDCWGCPVSQISEQPRCSGTPHKNWCDHSDRKHDGVGQNLCSICTRLARKELKFLEGLR